MNPKYHWFSQRITAVLTTIFLAISLSVYMIFGGYFAYYHYHMIACYFGMIGAAIGLWHGLLGVQTICEDYITNELTRKVTLAIINIVVYLSLIIGVAIVLTKIVLSCLTV